MAPSYFLYKLTPPRPGFPADMDESEAAIMNDHFGFWQGLVDAGTALIYGPVADPSGMWGLAIVTAGDEDEVQTIGDKDPAVASGLGTVTVMAMPDAMGPT
jgi:uncharacterized protein YciI